MNEKERFWPKVNIESEQGCWLWIGCKNFGGYGFFYVSATPDKKGHMEVAHRISYEWAKGPVPEGLKVLHNCPGGDNPACVNPSHLFAGTHQENMEDCKRKGRLVRRGPINKLTVGQAMEAIRLLAGGSSQRSLAIKYGVSVSTIHAIAKGRRWIHLSRDVSV